MFKNFKGFNENINKIIQNFGNLLKNFEINENLKEIFEEKVKNSINRMKNLKNHCEIVNNIIKILKFFIIGYF